MIDRISFVVFEMSAKTCKFRWFVDEFAECIFKGEWKTVQYDIRVQSPGTFFLLQSKLSEVMAWLIKKNVVWAIRWVTKVIERRAFYKQKIYGRLA